MKNTFPSDPVLYCNCTNTKNIPEVRKKQITAALRCSGDSLVLVDDLCGLAVDADPCLKNIANAEKATVIACYPRAILALFHRAGAPLNLEKIRLFNMRTQSAEEIIAAIDGGRQEEARREQEVVIESSAGKSWRPWFPVIDYRRCVHCRQCLEFCLFGVYETDQNGNVTVQNPVNCKNNCPSCARICPHLAIMFPKIDEESPVTGSEADAESAVGKVCLTKEQLFNADTTDRLRARQNRPSLIKKQTLKKNDDTTID